MTEESLSSPSASAKSPAKIAGLAFFFILLVLFLTMLKLPEARITGFIQGMVQSALDPYGIYLTDRGRELSILSGIRYRLEHPVVELPDQTRVEFDEMIVEPKLSSLLTGKLGVHAELRQGSSQIRVDAAGKGEKLDAEVFLESVDLGKLGVFTFAAGLKGSGVVSGEIKVAGSLTDLSSLNGALELKLKKLRLEEQNVMGFQLPLIQVNEGDLQVDIKAGKLQMKNVQIGKGMDDLRVQVTGDLGLNRYLNASTLNLRAVIGLSEKLRQSLALIESLMGSAKTPDGRYAYKLSGTLGAPMPMPDPQK